MTALWQPIALSIVRLSCIGLLLLGYGAQTARADDADSLKRAAQQLASSQAASGLLDFDFDFLKDSGNGSGKSNLQQAAYIVREAGAAYALAKYYRYSGDATMKQVLTLLIARLGQSSATIGRSRPLAIVQASGLLSLPFGRLTMAQWLARLGWLYRPAGQGLLLALEHDPGTAWVGGTALALLAEVLYADASGDSQFAALRLAWYRGLLAQHTQNRGFRDFPQSIEEAPLANGEIWLALAHLDAGIDHGWAAMLLNYERYLIATYTAKPDKGFFSWGMMAAATRFRSTRDARYLGFIESQARHFLGAIPLEETADDNSCSVVEGLAAAAAAMQAGGHGEAPLFGDLMQRISLETAHNAALQIQPGTDRIDLAGGAKLSSPKFAHYAGAFFAGASKPYVRVDFTGHCISALIEIARIKRTP